MKKCFVGVLFAVSMFALATPAKAVVLTFEYMASVNGGLGLLLPIGSLVTGTFSYDTSVADSSPVASLGVYSGAAASFQGGALSGGFTAGAALVADDVADIFGVQGTPIGGGFLSIRLDALTNAIWASDALPLTLDLADFVGTVEYETAGALYFFRAAIVSLTAVATDVPEPATLAVFGAGLFALGLKRRRTAA